MSVSDHLVPALALAAFAAVWVAAILFQDEALQWIASLIMAR